MSYGELCFAVLRPLIAESELSTADLKKVLRTALGVFHDPCVVPTVPLGDDARIFMCELWHGPTLAFKDLGLQVLGALLDHFLAKRNERLMVLVGTSGDTGKCQTHRLIMERLLLFYIIHFTALVDSQVAADRHLFTLLYTRTHAIRLRRH